MTTIRALLTGLFVAGAIVGSAAADMQHGGGSPHVGQSAFHAAMEAAMAGMHGAMMSVSPTGDPDRDFAAMMIPHHQGAIEMAEIELRFGKDERLRRLAQGIIVEQRQEIEVMQQILDDRPPASAAKP
jgi:uncharacterized protein (DUF305 family)